MSSLLVRGAAVISSDALYRYWLTRRWARGRMLVFVMLNPSKADALIDDMTITLISRRARSMGFASLGVANVYAYRATLPTDLLRAADPAGPDNRHWLRHALLSADMIVAAWGDEGARAPDSSYVKKRAALYRRDIFSLGLTKAGSPRHPLRIAYDVEPTLWIRNAA